MFLMDKMRWVVLEAEGFERLSWGWIGNLSGEGHWVVNIEGLRVEGDESILECNGRGGVETLNVR